MPHHLIVEPVILTAIIIMPCVFCAVVVWVMVYSGSTGLFIECIVANGARTDLTILTDLGHSSTSKLLSFTATIPFNISNWPKANKQ